MLVELSGTSLAFAIARVFASRIEDVFDPSDS